MADAAWPPESRPSVGRHQAGWLRGSGIAVLTVAVALAGVSGCSSGPMQQATTQDSVAAPTTTAPATGSNSAGDQQLIERQYAAFWRSLTPASSVKPEDRRRLLSPVTADPELTSLLTGIARDRRRGRVYYGRPVLHPRIEKLVPDKGVAVVRDCQDAAGTGDRSTSTGRLITRGSAHTLVISTMHRAAGTWKVAFVSFPGRSC
jgi:hypothetical protein